MDSHDAEEAYAKVTLFDSSDTQKKQKEAEQAYKILRQFESAHTDSEQKEAINKVEKFLATCDDGELVWCCYDGCLSRCTFMRHAFL